MIIGLVGKIVKKEMTKVHLNVSGVIYEVFISIQCHNLIKEEEITLHITQIIREDAWSLYGFMELNEKRMFDTLIKINGVGPKVAMAICSSFTPLTFANITQAKDVTALKSVPGIGPKSASRIMVELAGFSLDVIGDTASGNAYMHEASLALESLGFKKELIQKALSQCKATDTSELVKEALKFLQK